MCAHALKVLDIMNVNLLPTHDILKRWTREANLRSQVMKVLDILIFRKEA